MYKALTTIIYICIWCLISMPIYAGITRDPTQPLSNNGSYLTDPDDLQIDAIIVSKKRNMVIIGGNYYKIGDTVLGARIIVINTHSVEFEDQNGRFTIEMPIKNIRSNISQPVPVKDKSNEKVGK